MWGAVAWEKSPVRPGHPKSRSHQANAYDRRSSGHFEYAAEPGRPLGRRSLQREKCQDLHRSMRMLNPSTLRIEGCVLGFLCGGENWTRFEPKTSAQKSTFVDGHPLDVCSSISVNRSRPR